MLARLRGDASGPTSGVRRRRSRCRAGSRRAAVTTGPRPAVRSAGHSGSIRSTSRKPGGDDLADPVAQRAVVLDVGRAFRRRRTRRRACGRSTAWSRVSPSGPGSSGNAQRVGWLVAKTQRPPGRSTRAASRITARRVGDERHRAERGERDVEASRRRRAGAGRRPARAAPSIPVALGAQPGVARACRPTGRRRPAARPAAASQREHIAEPAPTSRIRAAGRRRRAGGRRPRAAPPGTRRSRPTPRNVAVRGVVAVGVAVPPAAVGPHRRRPQLGRAAADPDRRAGSSAVTHGSSRLPCGS